MSSKVAGDDVARADRMRKYKEERRKQLAQQNQKQFVTNPQRIRTRRQAAAAAAASASAEAPVVEATLPEPTPPTGTNILPKVRTTRASRLRAAATASLDQPVSNRRQQDKRSSESKSSTSRPASSSSIETSATISPGKSGESSLTSSVTCSSVSDNVLVPIISDVCNVGGGDKLEVVTKTVDVKSSERAPSEEAARENNRNKHSTATTCSQRGQSSKQAVKPSSSPSAKDSSNDELSSCRGRTASSSQGNRTDSDSSKELSSTKRTSVSSPFTTATRRTPPRSSSSPRSSSHSPQSPGLKLQAKRRSVELKPQFSLSHSPKGNSADTGTCLKSTTKPSVKKLETRSISLEKGSESKLLKSKNDECDVNKRLNPSGEPIALREECKQRVPSSAESSKQVGKMTPGIENNQTLNISSPIILSKYLTKSSSLDNSSKTDKIRANNSRLSSRMDALAALTKETLARVDKLSKITPDKDLPETIVTNSANTESRSIIPNNETAFEIAKKSDIQIGSTSSPSKQVIDRLHDIDKVTEHLLDFEKRSAFGSFSKPNTANKKAGESASSLLSYTPVSILKRKSSQEEHGSSSLSCGAVSTPPVTFSPSVVDPTPSKSRSRSQGILKKRRSLDESHVHRRRSCSPEVAFADDYNLETRPILKSQRRSSLEEVIRGRSPDGHIHGILKRKTSRDSEPLSEDRSLGSPEPQGILKRKSNSSSSSSTTSSHVSIAQAVILAAAGGAEIVDDKDSVKPILKKKSFSEERPSFDSNSDGPRPILKKKSLTESDDNDHEKPKKPILKSSRKISLDDGNTSSFDLSEDDRGSRRSSVLKHRGSDNAECDSNVRPILKHPSRDHSQSPRPRLSFCSDDEKGPLEDAVGQHFVNPSFSLLRRLEANNCRTSENNEDCSRPSKFETGRLHSPNKLKEFEANKTSDQPHHPSVVLMRRHDRPKVTERSKSLASNTGDELDIILKSKRFETNDDGSNVASTSSATESVENNEEKPRSPRFPSIAERIQCMQKYMGVFDVKNNQGAIPKKRAAIGRYKTQPITVEELQNISSLELSQTNLRRTSSSSTSATTDTQSVNRESRDVHSNQDNRTAEDISHSPDPTWEDHKFKNYAASPGYGKNTAKSFGLGEYSNNPTNASADGQDLRSPIRGAFSRITASSGSPEYHPFPSPDFQHNSDSYFSRNRNPESELADSVVDRAVAGSESVESETNLLGSSVPSPQCYKFRKLFSEDLHSTIRDSLSGSRRSSGVREENSHLDIDLKDSSNTSDFSRLFKETARHNYTNFDSLEFSSLDANNTLNLSSNKGNIELVNSFSDLASSLDKKTDDITAPGTGDKIERPKSLFKKEENPQRGSREAALQELNELEVELEDVRCALDADSNALSGLDADHWSLNISIDSGVFNRMSSGDSGPLSEELSLPQDFLKKPDIVRDHQPPSLLEDKLTSPPLDLANNRFIHGEKDTCLQSEVDQTTPTHINKQPKMDLEYLKNKSKPNDLPLLNKESEKSAVDLQEEEKCDEPVDSPEQLFGLMKSNSVSARASMWQQLHQQANKPAVKPILRHSRSRAKDGCPSVLDRFKTQPITMDEVNDAAIEKDFLPLNQSKSTFNLSLEQDEEAKLDENDPAKLTLAEKMKLFGASVSHRPPLGAAKKPRSPRFQTMPVLPNLVDDALAMNRQKNEGIALNGSGDIVSPKSKIIKLSIPEKTEEFPAGNIKRNALAPSASFNILPRKDVNRGSEFAEEKKPIGANFKQAQNKIAEQASKMLASEVKGILKCKSGAVPLLPTGGDKIIQPISQNTDNSEKENAVISTNIPFANKISPTSPRSAISKGGSSEGLKDEGINSSSDDESGSHSTDSSDDSCPSSDSSDAGRIHHKSRRPGSNEHLVKPSQLKSCRTESDVQRVLKENAKNEERGVKLPCMDEMRAGRIMERCMAKTNKENTNSVKQAVVKKAPMEKNTEQSHEANVKLKNLRNGNFPMSQSLDSSHLPENHFNKNGSFLGFKKNEDTNQNSTIPAFMRKYVNPVSKSQSMHMFHSQLGKHLKNGKEESSVGSGDGSGSDGDSSGGREIRRIINKRRSYRAQPTQESQDQGVDTADTTIGVLRRSATQPMSAQTASHRGGNIAKITASLEQSGNEWQRKVAPRISPEEVSSVFTKNKFNDNLNKQAEENKKSLKLEQINLGVEDDISSRKSKLEISNEKWKNRIEPPDAFTHSVEGKMTRDAVLSNFPPSSPLAPALVANEDKRTPQPNKFRSRRAEISGGIVKSLSTAMVPEPAGSTKKTVGDFKRSLSVSGVDDMNTENGQTEDNVMTKSEDGTLNGTKAGAKVTIPRPDDETFASFFRPPLQTSSLVPHNNNNIHLPVHDIDLNAIDTSSIQKLGKTLQPRIKATRKIGGSGNHLKVRAARTDIKQEYTEVPTTGISGMELNRLKKEKVALNSPLAVEALAGLASSEDFTAVNLKKTSSSTVLGGNGAERNTGKPLLIHVKGRRKVQVRLIDPVAESVNSGDCFVLVTTSQVFCYLGVYSNIIERTRATDVAMHINNKKDLGCVNSTSVITLDEQQKHKTPKHWNQFWTLLGVEKDVETYTPTPAGSVDEDEVYESEITSTNMCYEVMDDAFVPIKSFWGQTPKISMLDPAKILVFDFGSELYVWNGKNTILENRRRAFQLAQEMWEIGYDYKDCLIDPINIAKGLGARKEFNELPKTDSKRPDWAMLAKVTQHMETVLFKDKFLDWPDFTRVIKVKEEEDTFKGAAEIKSCNVDVMWNREYEDPSLQLEGSHVGRGTQYYDKETMRFFEIKTKSITKWMIQEYDYLKTSPEDLNEFYSGDTYIIRWEYQITVTGRELNGKPSKHNVSGRDRCAYFYWQGKDASANEKGAAALLTVELDQEKGPQIRVTQSNEPPAFLNMFNGYLVVHQGKKDSERPKSRMYTVKGNVESEAHIVQVSCSMRQLRSRASFIIVDAENGQVYVWHGCRSLKHTKSVALEAAKKLAARKHPDMFSNDVADVKITEVTEGNEPKAIIDILGGSKRELYDSMLQKEEDTPAVTTRLFHFTDLSSQFEAIEILSPLRHESLITPYPFSQNKLYSASQPALFLVDSGDRLWLWQGWWPQQEETESTEAYTGSHRWQVCRRAAMETVLDYWKLSRPGISKPEAYMAIAGLEPLAFTNLFDDWHNRDDVAEINMAQGYGAEAEELSVAEQLYQLSSTSFPLAVLRQRPLPDSVDPAQIERYLSDSDFQETFNMSKSEFYELPAWKQANIKKDLGLF